MCYSLCLSVWAVLRGDGLCAEVRLGLAADGAAQLNSRWFAVVSLPKFTIFILKKKKKGETTN